jgi:hypothetical protein
MLMKVVAGKAKQCKRATVHFRNISHEKEQNDVRIEVKML